ncbi:heme-binding protein 2-like [Diadema antillarum]|uniref:heme-binding protein 2-like n=1 Tax=Diadema antillarum TaxID=105358 RepID=UPI003A869368
MKRILCLLMAMISAQGVYGRHVFFATKARPAFCKGLDCPTFNDQFVGKKYEERLYEAANWVGTEVLDLSYERAVSQGFERNFHYISGNNTAGEKIPMTAPVAVRIIPGQGPACKSNFTIYFFIPHNMQSDPPQPTETDVFIQKFPRQSFYVRSFSGRAREEDWYKNADQLGEDLTLDNRTFEKSFYFTAGYDSPFTVLDRHNEVWFAAKD